MADAMPTGEYNHPLFGLVRFRTKTQNKWVRGDAITFISGFDTSEVIEITVPQLADVQGGNGGKVRFHKRGKKQLISAFADIEKLNLLKHITQTAGAFNQRLKKPTSGALSKEPSNHSFGIAVDLNSNDGCNGCTTAPVASVFIQHGFKWGKSFNDPMHYEITKFIDNDSPSVKEIALKFQNENASISAFNIFGDMYLDMEHSEVVPGVKLLAKSDEVAIFSGPDGHYALDFLSFGGREFISLPRIAGVGRAAMNVAANRKSVSIVQI